MKIYLNYHCKKNINPRKVREQFWLLIKEIKVVLARLSEKFKESREIFWYIPLK